MTGPCPSGSRELAGRGLVIVSGGAVGIDTAAHRGAVEAGGRTPALLSCGLDVDYPRENRALFERLIASAGALVTEYPLGAQPEAWRFPLKKRRTCKVIFCSAPGISREGRQERR